MFIELKSMLFFVVREMQFHFFEEKELRLNYPV